MRAIDISLFLAAPALVSAATASLRKRISGYATFYYTQTGNAYVCSWLPVQEAKDGLSRGSCGSYLSDSGFVRVIHNISQENLPH